MKNVIYLSSNRVHPPDNACAIIGLYFAKLVLGVNVLSLRARYFNTNFKIDYPYIVKYS